MRRFLPFPVLCRALLPLLAVLIALLPPASAQEYDPEQEQYAMRGTVVSPSGVPIAGAAVYAAVARFTRQPVWASSPAVTDRHGRFLVVGIPGIDMSDGTLAVVPPAGAAGSTAAVTFLRVKTNGPNTVTLARATRLTVKFTDQNGTPFANRRVFFWREYNFGRRPRELPLDRVSALTSRFPSLPPPLERRVTARTDARGVLTLARAERNTRYSVVIDAAPGRLLPPMLSQPLVTGSGPETHLPTIRLPLNEVRWGAVRHPGTGKPLAGALVKLYPPRTGGLRHPMTAVTDRNGRYRFTGLYPGTYFVDAQAPPGYLIMEAPKRRAPLRPGETNFYAVRAANIVVHVRGADGKPVWQQEIGIEKNTAYGWNELQIDREKDLYGDWDERFCGTIDTWTIRTDRRGLARFTVPLSLVRLRWKRASDFDLRSDDAPDETRIAALREGEFKHVYFGPDQPKESEPSALAPAPDFAALDPGGKKVRLSDFRGSPVVFDLLGLPGRNSRGEFWDLTRTKRALESLRAASEAASLRSRDPVVALAVFLDPGGGSDSPETFRMLEAIFAPDYGQIRLLRVPVDSGSVPLDKPIRAYLLPKRRPARHYFVRPDGTFRDLIDPKPSTG